MASALEYGSCAWLRAFEVAGDDSAGCSEEAYTWVALQVLAQEPFRLEAPDVVAFYAEMLAHLDDWLQDLQAMLPADSLRPTLSEDDVRVHLSRVVLAVVGRWIAEVEAGGQGAPEAAAFRWAWPQTAEALLARLAASLRRLRGHRPAAQRLLADVLRLEAAGRLACMRGSPSDAAHPGPPSPCAGPAL